MWHNAATNVLCYSSQEIEPAEEDDEESTEQCN